MPSRPAIGSANMAAAGQLSPTSLSLTLDRLLEDAQHTGVVDLSCRKLREYPRICENYELADTIETNLSKNRLNELPTQVCCYLSSEVLNCYHNCLRSLPEAILNLQQLTYLNLSRNQLSHLPPYISQLQSLEVLLVRNNKLVALPESLGQLPKLVELDASWNEIMQVPAQLGDLQNLRSFNLSRNALVEVPPELCKLKLRSLDLSSNRLQSIPLEYRLMNSLDRLALDNNPLVCPPAHICTKGRVHIMKYLQIVALREDRKKGASSEGFISRRDSGRRSSHRNETGERSFKKGTAAVGGSPSPEAAPVYASPLSTACSRSPKHACAKQQYLFQGHESPNGLAGSCGLSPIARVAAGMHGSATQMSPQFPEFHQDRAASSSPNSTSSCVSGEDTCIGMYKVPPAAHRKDLLKRKQEYEQKRRRASATSADDQQQHQQQSLIRSRSGVDARTATSPQSPMSPHEVMRPTSSTASTLADRLKPYLSASSISSEASRADTVVSVDSLNGCSVTTATCTMNRTVAAPRGSAAQASGTSAASKPPHSAVHKGRPSGGGAEDNQKQGNGHRRMQLMQTRQHSLHDQQNGKRLPEPSAPAVCGSRAEGIQRLPSSSSEHSETVETAEMLKSLKATLESRLKITLSEDLTNDLRDGVILCHLVNHVRPRSVPQIHMASAAVPKLTMAKCRKNVDNFIQACRSLGVPEDELCTVSDVLDNKLPLLVARTVQALCRLDRAPSPAQTHSNTPPLARLTTPLSERANASSSAESANSVGLPRSVISGPSAARTATARTLVTPRGGYDRKSPQAPSAV